MCTYNLRRNLRKHDIGTFFFSFFPFGVLVASTYGVTGYEVFVIRVGAPYSTFRLSRFRGILSLMGKTQEKPTYS